MNFHRVSLRFISRAPKPILAELVGVCYEIMWKLFGRWIGMRVIGVLSLLCFLSACSSLGAVDVGVAKIDITPDHPVILAGYGGRTEESEGVDTKLWARAIAIGAENPVVLIVVDNCGVPASLVKRLAAGLAERSEVRAQDLVVAATHTHNAPALPDYARVLWAGRASAAQEENARRYSRRLESQLLEVGLAALSKRQPATLEWGIGRVEFGGNRRIMRDGVWRGFGFQANAPVDHSLPLLVARGRDGKPFAIWTSYACHCTTIGGRNRIAGDWAGFSNREIESSFESCVALTSIGCGADVGPQPSGSIENAENHGQAIASEVRRLVSGGKLRRLRQAPVVRTREIKLPLQKVPERGVWERQAELRNFNGELARRMLRILDAGQKLPTHVDYPVTTWSFDKSLAVVFLAGEVVVDYSVRLKRELDWSRLWINAWCDDVPSYIPSRRILREGGYESEFSQVYYDLPAPYALEVEDLIVSTVKQLLPATFLAADGMPPSPFHVHPIGDLSARLPPRLSAADQAAMTKRIAAMAERIRAGKSGLHGPTLQRALKSSVSGFSKLETADPQSDLWFDFTGTKSYRPFIRQQKIGDRIAWESAPVPKGDSEDITLVFAGGLGWESQAKTPGFELAIGGEKVIEFDVTRDAIRWTNEFEEVEILYVPTWSSNEDSAGFFFLTFARERAKSGQPVQLEVRSRGENSLRWFSIDVYERPDELARKLLSL